jgi:battenin
MVVYFSEYAMQSGAWAAIGFPAPTDEQARKMFYTNAGWCYQGGVFISRSSGVLFQANRTVLWVMPFVQFGLLLMFVLDAVHKFWYDQSLLFACFVTGLLGGAVYVNAFTLIAKEQPKEKVELALTAASIGDSLGVIAADVAGLYIQACLWKHNGIPGSKVSCPSGW